MQQRGIAMTHKKGQYRHLYPMKDYRKHESQGYGGFIYTEILLWKIKIFFLHNYFI
jgi:hypothetical protein